MRVSRDGGKTYPHKWVRRLDAGPFTSPAAVHLHDQHGCGHVLVLDLDAAAGTVEADYAALSARLDRCGAAWLADISPSGGRHVYVPLDTAIAHSELADAAARLAGLFPSIDPGPHRSADTGCIRPPGSTWKRGGYQRLTTGLQDAIGALIIGNSAAVLDRLLAGTPEAAPAPAAEIPDVDVTAMTRDDPRQLSPRLAAIARSGIYDTDRYPSPSEARQAVITGAVRAGLTLPEVIRRVETGTWPGLAGLYARYRGPRTALTRDWRKAITWLAGTEQRSVQSFTTSPKVTAGPATTPQIDDDVHAGLRRIEAHLAHTEPAPTSAAGWKRRFLLRALLAAAHQDGSLTIARGARSLSITTGIDRTQIPAALQALCDEAAPLLRKVSNAHGKDATAYALLPPAPAEVEASTPWQRGLPVHALRPVFRILGLTAATVYEALELHPDPATGRQVAAATGLSPTTVLDALALLHSHGLVSTTTAGGNTLWSTTSTTVLTEAGERLGAIAIVAALIHRFRAERLLWWAWLAEAACRRQAEHIDTGPEPPLWPPAAVS